MKIEKSRLSGDSGGVNLPHAHVSAPDYEELAKAAVRANGGKGFVVERNRRSEQWRAWMAYFHRMEWQTHDKQGKPYTVNRGKVYESMQAITVPTAWPLEFDASAPSPRQLTRDDMPIGPERKRELAAMLRKLGSSLGGVRDQSAPIPDARYAQTPEARHQAVAFHEQHLAELKARYAANPLPANENGQGMASGDF